jgi:hypothetical protein
MVPPGPVMGGHVAPVYWLWVYGWFIKIFMGPWGSTHGPLPTVQSLNTPPLPMCHIRFLTIHVCLKLYKLKLFHFWRGGSGWGLAPTRGFGGHTCDHCMVNARKYYITRSHIITSHDHTPYTMECAHMGYEMVVATVVLRFNM